MAEQVTISRVYHDMVETKYGPKPKTSIYTVEHPDVKMSSFDKGISGLKEGDVIEITIEKKGQFTNFKTTGAVARHPAVATSSDLERRVARLEASVYGDGDMGAASIIAPSAIAKSEEGNDYGDFE